MSPGRELACRLECKHLCPVLCPLLAGDQRGLTRGTVVIEKTEQPNPPKTTHNQKSNLSCVSKLFPEWQRKVVPE